MPAFLLIFIKGALMGLADLVPGVSGGTIAFVTGIYSRLIGAIRDCSLAFPLLLRFRFRAFFRAFDFSFLLVLAAGIGMSLFFLAGFVHQALTHYTAPTYALFLGLILGSIIVLFRGLPALQKFDFLWIFLGLVGGYAATHLPSFRPNDLSFWYIFFSASLAICAMILPGISGSFILLILGVYVPVLAALRQLDFVFLSIFAAGALFGLLSFVQLVAFLFRRYERLTLLVLLGFLAGSMPKIWPWQEPVELTQLPDGSFFALQVRNVLPSDYTGSAYFGLSLVLIVLGFLLVFIVEKKTK